MRVIVTRASAHLPTGVRGAALFAFGCAGCSLILAHGASQCSRDSDCQALGLVQTTCDLAANVCRSASGGAGPGSAGGAGGAGSIGGSIELAGEAGMPDGGAAQGGVIDAAGRGGSSGTGTGGSTNKGGSGGTGGMAVGGSGNGGAAPVPDWSTLPAPGNGMRVRVRSFCEGSLWLHLANNASTLMPDDVQLANGREQAYIAPSDWPAARIAAFGTGPRKDLLDKIDLSIAAGSAYYSLQYLDGFGLPMQVGGVGGNCTALQTKTCNAHQSDVATCPEDFLKQGARCLSASVHCQVPANQVTPYCHAFDSAIAACSGCPGGSTPEVYAGSGPYSTQPKFGAALNRGMLAEPDSTDASKFYKQPPYNSYAKWLLTLCPDVLAFPNDSYGKSGVVYPNCSASELRITFCPAR